MSRSIRKLTCNSRRLALMSLIALAYLGVGWLSLAGVKTGGMSAAHAQSAPAASSSSQAGQAAVSEPAASQPATSVLLEAYDSWPVLVNPFESTGGGSVMIGEYAPIIEGSTCRTDFTATPPGGPTYRNSVEWTATPVQGGTLCQDGKWRAKDGSAFGTTPFQVFIKDGLVRRMP
jgi:hypothetical protein